MLCLLMAIYLLNFSIDTTTERNFGMGTEAGIKEAVEVENLLCLALDLHIAVDLEEELPEKTETENEVETADYLEFFDGVSLFSLLPDQTLLQEHLLHFPSPDLKTLYPEVICPPPKAFFHSAIA